jgi:transcription termination factor NusA
MEDAIAKAARSRYGAETDVHAEIEPKTGDLRLTRHMLVVEAVENPSNQITLEEARKRHPAAQVGDTIADPLPPLEYGRIAAQSAKQVIVQKVREAERDRQYAEYKDRIGDIVNGIVKRVEYGNVVVDLGRGEAIVRRDELLPREVFRNGDRIRAYIYDVRREPRGPQIFLSRTHPAIHVKAVRAGSAGNLRRHRRGQGSCPRSRARAPRSPLSRAILGRSRSAPASACAVRACRRWSMNCRARRSTSFHGRPTSPPSW